MPKGLPVLMISGEEDPVGGYGKQVDRVYRDLTGAGLTNVELKMYPGDRHEILNEMDKQQVMEDIAAWMEKTMG
jgi:alpha-beta hydrolase superfamily lysophospholipase